MKRLISILIPVVLSLLVACGNDDTAENEGGEVEDVEDSVEETEVEEESVNSDEQEVEQIVGMIFELHGDDFDVTYDEEEDAVLLTPSSGDIIDRIGYGKEDRDGINVAEWVNVRDILLMQSEMATAAEGRSYTIIVREGDEDILVIEDDEIQYDFATE